MDLDFIQDPEFVCISFTFSILAQAIS